MSKAPRRSAPINWRLWLRIGFWTLLAGSTLLAARAVSRFAQADPHFTLDRDAGVTANPADFTILGRQRASKERILRVFENDFGGNIFQMPIDERRRKLLAVDWVERASVSRVWPNRIAVRIWERQPVAFVNLTPEGARKQNARLALIDAYGVILDRPERLNFSAPILSGVYENQSERERQGRVRHYLRLMEALGPLGKRIAEVNVAQPDNLRVGMEVDGREFELLIGDRNFKRRLQDFLDHYAEIRIKTAGATSFDLRLDDRITTRE